MHIHEVGGGAAAGVVLTIVLKWGGEIISFLANGKEIGFFKFGKNGHTKITKDDLKTICPGNHEKLIASIREDNRKTYESLRVEQREDLKMLHEDILYLAGKK